MAETKHSAIAVNGHASGAAQPRTASKTANRLTITIDDRLSDGIRALADRRGLTATAVINELLAIGLRVRSVLETPGGGVWVREREGEEKERIWLPNP